MSFVEFINWALAQGSVAKFNDGKFLGQCVSLINQYCWRVLNIPADAWGNAKDWAINTAPLAYFDKVQGNPLEGDILIYGAEYGGGDGHIEISLGGNRTLFQNRNGNGKVGIGTIIPGCTAILRPKKGEDMAEKITLETGRILFYMLGYDGIRHKENAMNGDFDEELLRSQVGKQELNTEYIRSLRNSPAFKESEASAIGLNKEALAYRKQSTGKPSGAVDKLTVIDYINKNLT